MLPLREGVSNNSWTGRALSHDFYNSIGYNCSVLLLLIIVKILVYLIKFYDRDVHMHMCVHFHMHAYLHLLQYRILSGLRHPIW